ncbi:MAG TPA: GNAT family N-acetyltransferase, partial [Planctomycetota bacterium]|nr:GNAT family N-acetyltransferase [Planctomycetota bacterium]
TSLGDRFLAEVFYGSILSREEGVGVVAHRGNRLLGFVVGAYPAGRWYQSLVSTHRTEFVRSALGRLSEGPTALVELAEVGVAMLQGSSDPTGFPADLGYIAVEEEARGLGLGRRLVKRFLEALAARGASGCWTKTYATNTAARKLYERSGFKMLGRRRIRRIWSVYYGIELAAQTSTSPSPSRR